MDVEPPEKKEVGRPRKADADCSAACQRKRAERERKLADKGLFQIREEANEKSKAYRAKKRRNTKRRWRQWGSRRRGRSHKGRSLRKRGGR